MDKMIGRKARKCEFKSCTCNEGQTKNRRKDKRATKRRERQTWKKEV